VAVIAVGALGLAVLRPGQAPIGGQPSPSLQPSPSPSLSPSPTPLPALTQTFVSTMHGISVSYPARWNTRKATEPWTTGIPKFDSEFGDVAYDNSTDDLKFLGLASQALGGLSGAAWVSKTATAPEWESECPPQPEPLTVDGAPGKLMTICPSGALVALVTTADRGYLVVLYGVDDRAWFNEILATVQLHPEDAVKVSPSPSR
jgi:hypothetical protein